MIINFLRLLNQKLLLLVKMFYKLNNIKILINLQLFILKPISKSKMKHQLIPDYKILNAMYITKHSFQFFITISGVILIVL